MEEVYVVISEYSEDLAKKQPWYGIKKLKNDLIKLNFNVSIIHSLNQVPKDFHGRVIKLFGMKDLFILKKKNYKLIFLFTSPIISFSKVFSIGLNTILKNWRYLYKIFLLSMSPKQLLIRSFRYAEYVLLVSDTLERYFYNVSNLYKYIPFTPNNWQTKIDSPLNYKNNQVTLGYFGPPYLTRHFDSVIDFFSWIQANQINYQSKLITRIDDDSLKKIQEKYFNKLSIHKTKIISGFLSRPELLHELSEVDIMILPFRVVMEELPIVVIESLELGIPVVTTVDCGIFEITKGRKDILILDSFSKNSYEEILHFIENFRRDNFNNMLNNINSINNIALDKLCNL